VLGLGIHTDLASQLVREPLAQVEHLLQRRDLEAPVVLRVRRADIRDPLLRTQRLELGEREVLGEPARQRDAVDHLRRPAIGELGTARDVRRRGDLVLVARDQHPVLRAHQIWLDEVGALLGRKPVGRQRVLGAVPGGAPMPDHERPGFGVGRCGGRGGGRKQAERQHGGEESLESHDAAANQRDAPTSLPQRDRHRSFTTLPGERCNP
jgi:hypothetical protein